MEQKHKVPVTDDLTDHLAIIFAFTALGSNSFFCPGEVEGSISSPGFTLTKSPSLLDSFSLRSSPVPMTGVVELLQPSLAFLALVLAVVSSP